MWQTLFGQRQQQRTPQPTSPTKQMQVEELQQRLEAGEPITLIDVRTPGEYEHDGHIIGSRLLPLPVLQQRSNELPKDRPIVCICRSGHRSQIACEMLAAAGFSDLNNLAGGMLAWKRAQFPHK